MGRPARDRERTIDELETTLMTGPGDPRPLCPNCRQPIGLYEAWCTGCGIPLLGAPAAQLGRIDQRLAVLDAERDTLLTTRGTLLSDLRRAAAQRAAQVIAAPPASQAGPSAWSPPPPAVPPPPPAAPAHARPETSAPTVQNVLLALGGVLLAVAAVVFTVIAWGRFGIGGRAAILAGFTTLTFAAPVVLLRRELRATAETIAAVGLVLLALDGYAAWHVGFLSVDTIPFLRYAGLVAAVVALFAAVYPRWVPVRLLPPAAVLVAQPVIPLLFADAQPTQLAWAGIGIGWLAGNLVLVALTAGPNHRTSQLMAWLGTLLAAGVSAASALTSLTTDLEPARVALSGLILIVLCGLGVVGARMASEPVLAEVATGSAVILTATTVGVAYFRSGAAHVDLVLAGLAAGLAIATAPLPKVWRTGPMIGAAAVAAVSVVPMLLTALYALIMPLSWVGEPWTLAASGSRAAWSPFTEWTVSWTVLPDLALGGVAIVVLAAKGLGRAHAWLAATVAGAATLVLTGLSLDLVWWLILVIEGAGIAVASVLALRGGLPPAVSRLLWACTVTLAVHLSAWSLADRTATQIVLGLLAVGAAAVAIAARRHPLGYLAVVVALLALPAEAAALAVANDATLAWVAVILYGSTVPAIAVVGAVRGHSAGVAAGRIAAAAGATVPLTSLAATVVAGYAETPVALALTIAALLSAGAAAVQSWTGNHTTEATRRLVAGAAALYALVSVTAATPWVAVNALAPLDRPLDIWSGSVAPMPTATDGFRNLRDYVGSSTSVVVTLLLAAVALGLVVATRRRPTDLVGAAAVVGTALALVGLAAPTGFDLGWVAELGWLAVVTTAAGATALLAGATAAGRIAVRIALPVAALAGIRMLVLSLVTPTSTLLVLYGLTGLAAVVAWYGRTAPIRLGAAVLAAVSGHAAVAASAAAAGLPAYVCGEVMLIAVAVAAGVAAALTTRRPEQAIAVEACSVLGALAALVLTAGQPWHTGLVLALCGAIAAAVALRPDRRRLALVAVGLEIAASWAWLAAAGIRAPEAYTLPAATLAAVAGIVMLSRRPQLSSWTALGPALAAGLVPSLTMTFTAPDETWRRLLLGIGVLAIALAGARWRRQAPLVLGGTTLVVVVLHELAPFLADIITTIPRWVPIALGGVLLIFVGATYERRRNDVRRLGQAVSRMH